MVASHTVYPTQGLQVLSSLIHLLSISILAWCLARRLTKEHFPTWMSFLERWPQTLIVVCFICSWMFIFCGALLLWGVSLNLDAAACHVAELLCIFFYGTSKVFIYLFLAERVFVVWGGGRTRLETRPWLFAIGAEVIFAVPVTIVIWGHIHEISPDGICYIGQNSIATFTVLAYDIFICFVLTGLFLYPILSSKFFSAYIRRLTLRTLVQTVVGLTTSTLNMAVLFILHGKEEGWICLASCSLDVMVNVLALYWVTSNSGRADPDTTVSSGPNITVTKSKPNASLRFAYSQTSEQETTTSYTQDDLAHPTRTYDGASARDGPLQVNIMTMVTCDSASDEQKQEPSKELSSC